jgi:hypothetical protein
MKFNNIDGIKYLTFEIFPSEVVHGIFTRQGGVSSSPWDSLNVGGTVGDKTELVRENRYRSFAALGRSCQSIFDVWQVHSADIVVANASHDHLQSPPVLKADGMVTDNPSVSLFMRFADCTPVMLYDPRHKVIGIVHAGWLGTVRRVVEQAVKTMRGVYGSRPVDILAGIGPAIGPDHYEIGADVIEQINYSFGRAATGLFCERNGKYYFDLWKANKLTLNQAGVEQVEVAGLCTACHPEDWYSHRAQKGKTGRFGALIGISET